MALCAALYAWTADFPMVFDDEMYMKNNPLFLDARSFNYPVRFIEFANIPGKLGGDPDLATNFITRPVSYATLRLNYWLDGFNPRWFRVVNVVIHATSSVLVFALSWLLLRRGGKGAGRDSMLFISAVPALLFAVHPLATESVTYIIQRFTSLSTLFYLLTLCLYFLSLDASSGRARLILRVAATVSLLAGMLTKECTFTAPLMAVLLDVVVRGARLRTAAWRALPLLLCLPVIPALVILTSMAQNGGRFDLEAVFNIVNSRDRPLNHWHYVITQITVAASYLRRIFWPSGLNIDPEWPLHTSLTEPAVMKALAVLLALVIGAAWVWRRHRGDARARLAFGFTLWFFVTLATSSLIVPLPDLLADHRAYLPSIGILVLTACALDRLREAALSSPLPVRAWVPAGVLAAVAALAWTTTLRNAVWSSPLNLWEDTVAKSPGKFRTWGNLGAAWSNAGKEEEAVKCFQKALQIEPRFQHAMFNLSNSLLRLGRSQESLDTSLKLIRTDRNAARRPEVAFTFGLGLAGSGRYDDALHVLKEVLAAAPDDPRCHRALGSVYLRKNQPSIALDHFRRASALMEPDQNLLNDIRIAEAAASDAANSQPAFKPVINPNFRLR